jgi:hypothetical protein
MVKFVQGNGQVIMIPQTWDDLSLDQFIAMVESRHESCIQIFSILIGLDYREIAHIDAPIFTDILCESMVYFRENSPEDWMEKSKL